MTDDVGTAAERAQEAATMLEKDVSKLSSPAAAEKPRVVADCPCDCVTRSSIQGAVCGCSGPADDDNRCDMRGWYCLPGTYSSATGIQYSH